MWKSFILKELKLLLPELDTGIDISEHGLNNAPLN